MIVLGIHNGHHASCAIVRGGRLISAVAQERFTRVKGDGADGLTNRLPVSQCLRAAGVRLEDVDLIVSSFQSMGPGGVGLARPLAEPSFDLFDPHDPRHHVASHHLAHAHSALGTSSFSDAAIVVCDLSGSTTVDGLDFVEPFSKFEKSMTSLLAAVPTRTECLSIYDATADQFTLRHREYCIPHNTPEVFICSTASLYDNVSRLIFNRENAHGELMALASMANSARAEVDVNEIVHVDGSHDVTYRNNWQSRVRHHDDALGYAPLARVVQEATEKALLAAVARARKLTTSRNLVAAGGSFLNINANSRVHGSGLFERAFVPSSPHDAGIAVGCAFLGWRMGATRGRISVAAQTSPSSDRLGILYSEDERLVAIQERSALVEVTRKMTPAELAELLRDGRIVGRWAGRAEFGPRALGGRSLLASPLLLSSKDRLNRIKGRQPWRPVAPVVPFHSLSTVFDGPALSPYMNLVHSIRPAHRSALAALAHPDHSARAQTLVEEDDPFLFATLMAFESLTGFPVLVNTSFNGPDEPIVERASEAISFLLENVDLDGLLLEDDYVERRSRPSLLGWRIASDVIASWVGPPNSRKVILLRRGRALEVQPDVYRMIESQAVSFDAVEEPSYQVLLRAAREGFLVHERQ